MQQRKSSAQHRAVTDAQASAAAQARRASREMKEVKQPKEPPPSTRSAGSGETTLGGHVDRGLTLESLYDLGVLERLRLEVRVRLLSDLAQSLAWLHANPRLMAAHPHLVIAPSTIVIGLDGVARVDVRAAKRRESERDPDEADYVAPEVAGGDTAADLRADIFSLGVLAWEALAGKRISALDAWPSHPSIPDGDSDVPPALGGGRERDPLHRKTPRSSPKPSHSRLRIPPPLSLPEEGEWATGLAELALQAMCADPAERPQDCRPIISALEQVAARLASTQEIAEVVQGISDVDTLCIPLPTLPDVDAACQSDESGALGFMDRQPCWTSRAAESCAQRPTPVARRVVEAPASPLPAAAPRVEQEPQEASRTRMRRRERGPGPSNPGWSVAAGLLALALLGLLAGYAATLLSMR